MNKDQYAFSFCSGSSVIKSSLLIFFLEGGIGRVAQSIITLPLLIEISTVLFNNIWLIRILENCN